MVLERAGLSSRILDVTQADGDSLHAEDASILASGGLNLQAFSRVILGIDTLPWQYWLLGILVTLVGNSFITLGFMIQKKSHQHDNENHLERWYFLSSTWLFGLFVFIVGHGSCWVGLALGAQSVLSCLSCWTMILTCVFAPCMLGESLSLRKTSTIFLLVVGCFLVVTYGSREYHILNREQFHHDLTGTVFVGLCTIIWLTAFFLGRHVQGQTPKVVMFKLCFYAALGAWYAVLSSKTMSGLVFTSMYHHDNQFRYSEFWILPVLFFGFAGWNLHFLNMALAQGEAVCVIPLYEAMSILGQVILGGFFFGEFYGLDTLKLLRFCLGVCCIVSGVALVNVPAPKMLEEMEPQESISSKSGNV